MNMCVNQCSLSWFYRSGGKEGRKERGDGERKVGGGGREDVG